MSLKNVIFWCPFISKVGTISAVIESAKALKFSKKKFECEVLSVFGEFDEYSNILLKDKIKVIKLTNFNFIKKLPNKGFFWSRLSYLLIIFLSVIPLYLYLRKNQNKILFTYLLTFFFTNFYS